MDYVQMFYDCTQVIHRKITNLPILESRKSQRKPKQCVFTILLSMQHSAWLLQIEFIVIGYDDKKGLGFVLKDVFKSAFSSCNGKTLNIQNILFIFKKVETCYWKNMNY